MISIYYNSGEEQFQHNDYIGQGSSSAVSDNSVKVLGQAGEVIDMFVHLQFAPGTGETWRISVSIDGTEDADAFCDISNAETTCQGTVNDDGPWDNVQNLMAADLLSVRVVSQTGVDAEAPQDSAIAVTLLFRPA